MTTTSDTHYCGDWAWMELEAPDFLPIGQRHLWPARPAAVCERHAEEIRANGLGEQLQHANPARTPLRCMVEVAA